MTISTFRYALASSPIIIGTPFAILADTFPVNSGAATANTTTPAVTAGTLVFMNLISTDNTGFTSLVDSAGNSYNLSTNIQDVSNVTLCLAWSIVTHAIPIGSTFTAVTTSAAQWGVGQVFAVTGPIVGLDKSSSVNNDSTTGTSLSLSTGVLTSSPEIVVGIWNTNGTGVTWTEDASFSTLHNDTFNITSYQTVSSTSSVTWHPTFTATGPFNAIVGSFR